MGEDATSRLRVFLSADLVGSAKLKNRLNHQELLVKYQARRNVVEKLREQDGTLVISPEVEQSAIFKSLAISTDDFDWATVIRAFYDGIHSEFVAALDESQQKMEIEIDLGNEFAPWKAIGDELIYSVPIGGRRELHHITIAFLRAIREMDRKIGDRPGGATAGLRIKGAAWVAGFPVRNREIELPPDSRLDYLGPDMDTGFRIAKCTRSAMLVVSVEMAELLGECQGQFAPMLGKIVGWEELKGVWNDQRYPVVWIDFPDSHPAASSHTATPFSLWDQEDCRWSKAWSDPAKPQQQLSELAHTLRGLRGALPPSLGLVDPYILDDKLETGQLPEDHAQILELLRAIEAHRSESNRQDAGEIDRAGRSIDEDVAQVQDLLKRTPKPSVDAGE